jgi:superfamily II DNA or RNA helicase
MAGKRRPLIQAPTGAGKTMIAAAVVQGALAKGNRVLFVVPALSLVDQTVAAFWAVGIRDVGVIQAQHEMTNLSRRVQVASVQTLQRRDIPLSEIVVIDECHRWFDFYGQWMVRPEWKSVPFVGLSATPWTKGLGKFFDDLIIAATTQELIDSGYLAPFRVFAPSHPDLSGVRIVAGDFHEGDLGEAMDKPGLVADVVDTWRQMGEGRPTLCFAVNRAHARSLQKQFEAAGIGCGYVDAFTPVDEREAVRKRLEAGEIQIVCNVGCLTTGVDWDVRCIILARPTRSEMLYTQIIGRGLRTAPGKADCIVLDHSDTTLRLGFVTDIHHDKLDDGKPRKAGEGKGRETPLPKECPACSFLKPARIHACPSCGFKPERQFEVETIDGELKELKGKKRAATMQEKRQFLGELTHIAMSRGYSPGWASHKFKERFGVWPHKDLGAPRFEPCPETISWVKSRQIAFAKRKEAA